MNLVASRNILNYKLEAVLETPERGVAIRREILSAKLPVRSALSCLPYKDYDYSQVLAPHPSRTQCPSEGGILSPQLPLNSFLIMVRSSCPAKADSLISVGKAAGRNEILAEDV